MILLTITVSLRVVGGQFVWVKINLLGLKVDS